jgi:hypothetical protein
LRDLGEGGLVVEGGRKDLARLREEVEVLRDQSPLADIAKVEGEAMLRGMRVDVQPHLERRVERFDLDRLPRRHRLAVARIEGRADDIGEGFPQVRADQVMPLPQGAGGVHIRDLPIAIHGDKGVRRRIAAAPRRLARIAIVTVRPYAAVPAPSRHPIPPPITNPRHRPLHPRIV